MPDGYEQVLPIGDEGMHSRTSLDGQGTWLVTSICTAGAEVLEWTERADGTC